MLPISNYRLPHKASLQDRSDRETPTAAAFDRVVAHSAAAAAALLTLYLTGTLLLLLLSLLHVNVLLLLIVKQPIFSIVAAAGCSSTIEGFSLATHSTDPTASRCAAAAAVCPANTVHQCCCCCWMLSYHSVLHIRCAICCTPSQVGIP